MRFEKPGTRQSTPSNSLKPTSESHGLMDSWTLRLQPIPMPMAMAFECDCDCECEYECKFFVVSGHLNFLRRLPLMPGYKDADAQDAVVSQQQPSDGNSTGNRHKPKTETETETLHCRDLQLGLWIWLWGFCHSCHKADDFAAYLVTQA